MIRLYGWKGKAYPNVETMRGPNPLTAPLTVYLDSIQQRSYGIDSSTYAAAIINATTQIFTSSSASFNCDFFKT